jgi:hypothetical protein
MSIEDDIKRLSETNPGAARQVERAISGEEATPAEKAAMEAMLSQLPKPKNWGDTNGLVDGVQGAAAAAAEDADREKIIALEVERMMKTMPGLPAEAAENIRRRVREDASANGIMQVLTAKAHGLRMAQRDVESAWATIHAWTPDTDAAEDSSPFEEARAALLAMGHVERRVGLPAEEVVVPDPVPLTAEEEAAHDAESERIAVTLEPVAQAPNLEPTGADPLLTPDEIAAMIAQDKVEQKAADLAAPDVMSWQQKKQNERKNRELVKKIKRGEVQAPPQLLKALGLGVLVDKPVNPEAPLVNVRGEQRIDFVTSAAPTTFNPGQVGESEIRACARVLCPSCNGTGKWGDTVGMDKVVRICGCVVARYEWNHAEDFVDLFNDRISKGVKLSDPEKRQFKVVKRLAKHKANGASYDDAAALEAEERHKKNA